MTPTKLTGSLKQQQKAAHKITPNSPQPPNSEAELRKAKQNKTKPLLS